MNGVAKSSFGTKNGVSVWVRELYWGRNLKCGF